MIVCNRIIGSAVWIVLLLTGRPSLTIATIPDSDLDTSIFADSELFRLTLCTANTSKNELGFRPPLCTYRLNWARRTSWGWWDDWDDTVLQTQDLKFEPWRSEAEHATSRSRRLPAILTFTRGWGRNIFVSFKPPRPGTEPRTLAWKAAVLTTTLGPPPSKHINSIMWSHRDVYVTGPTLKQHWRNVICLLGRQYRDEITWFLDQITFIYTVIFN